MDVSLVCYDSSDMSSDECSDSDDFLGLRTPRTEAASFLASSINITTPSGTSRLSTAERPSQLDSYPGMTNPTASAEVVDQINPGESIPAHPSSLNHGTGMEDRRDSAEVVRIRPGSPGGRPSGSYISQDLSLVPVNKAPKNYTTNPKSLPGPMQTFLCYVKGYFTKPVNLKRQRPAVTHSTFNKALERILGFLGFARDHLHLALTPDLFLRMSIIEDYLTYLKGQMTLSARMGQMALSARMGQMTLSVRMGQMALSARMGKMPL